MAILKFNYHHMANFNYNILQRSDVYPSKMCTLLTLFLHVHSKCNLASDAARPQPTAGSDFYLKVLCPENKKDYKTVTLRGLSPDNIDSPTKLKEAGSRHGCGLFCSSQKTLDKYTFGTVLVEVLVEEKS